MTRIIPAMLDASLLPFFRKSRAARSGGDLRPLPRLREGGLLGNLETFRHDRIGEQLRFAREFPELVRLRFGLTPVVCVNAPALAHEVLSTKNASFAKAPALSVYLKPLLGQGLLTSEGEVHASQRKLLAKAFSPKRMAGYAATMAERAERFSAAFTDGEGVDVSASMMHLTLEIVGKTLFDAEVSDDAEEVGEAITTSMECAVRQLDSGLPLPPFIPTPSNLEYRKVVKKLDSVIYRLIRRRRAEGVDMGDVLSILLEARDDQGLSMSDREIRDQAMTLFLAGHETTANALAWTLYLLAKHPDARARVEAELDALGHAPRYEDLPTLPVTLAAFKESMRLYPPAYVIPRRTTEAVTIGPYRFHRNMLVFVNVFGIHRRPDLFESPDEFRLERFLGDAEKSLPRCAYLPFGAGPRVCIGNHFATTEGHILLATLLRRLRFELATTAPIGFDPLITLRAKGGIPMRAAVRRPDA